VKNSRGKTHKKKKKKKQNKKEVCKKGGGGTFKLGPEGEDQAEQYFVTINKKKRKRTQRESLIPGSGGPHLKKGNKESLCGKSNLNSRNLVGVPPAGIQGEGATSPEERKIAL